MKKAVKYRCWQFHVKMVVKRRFLKLKIDGATASFMILTYDQINLKNVLAQVVMDFIRSLLNQLCSTAITEKSQTKTKNLHVFKFSCCYLQFKLRLFTKSRNLLLFIVYRSVVSATKLMYFGCFSEFLG